MFSTNICIKDDKYQTLDANNITRKKKRHLIEHDKRFILFTAGQSLTYLLDEDREKEDKTNILK